MGSKFPCTGSGNTGLYVSFCLTGNAYLRNTTWSCLFKKIKKNLDVQFYRHKCSMVIAETLLEGKRKKCYLLDHLILTLLKTQEIPGFTLPTHPFSLL